MHQESITRVTRFSRRLLLLSIAFLALPPAASANFIDGQIGGIDAELTLKLNPGDLTDDTGVLVKNLSLNGGNVGVELLTGPNDFNLLLPDGFVLLDNTLKVTSDLLPGGRRIRARMDLGRYGGRASIRQQGIRANSLRLLRADFTQGRWIRAVDSIRDKLRADIRFLTAVRADLVLGHHGIDPQKEFVWAVLDTSGEQYFAIGGLNAVPLPAGWLLFLSGSGLLALVTRRRRAAAQ